MVKTISMVSVAGIATSTIFMVIGAFVSLHVLITSLIALAVSVCGKGIATNLK